MFGHVVQEFLLLLILAVLLIGVPAGVIFLMLFLMRRQMNNRVAELEDENRRLREQLGK